MILRRISRSLSNQDWMALALELVVVVAGIFIAVQVDRWYASQKEQAEVRSHQQALSDDFAENEKRLVEALSENKRQIDAALTLRAEVRKEQPDLATAQLNQLFSEIAALPTFEAVNRTYQNLINSGNLASVLNAETQTKVVDFYTAYELTKLIQNSQELTFVTSIQPYMIANLDYAATARREIGDARRDLQPYIDADLILGALKTKEFENVVAAEWETAHDLRRNYTALLDQVTQIRQLMSNSADDEGT